MLLPLKNEYELGNEAAVRVTQAIQAMLPQSIAVAGGLIARAQEAAFPEELALLNRAIPKRRHEFLAGRNYARKALLQLGVPPAPIGTDEFRAPVWPKGIAGSISHSAGYCVAIATRKSSFYGVGIDVEVADPLPAEWFDVICTNNELACAVRTGYPGTSGEFAKLAFVLKESIFKAFFPGTLMWIEFLEAAIKVDWDHRSFAWRVSRASAPMLGSSGRFSQCDGTLVACAWIEDSVTESGASADGPPS